MIRMDKISVKDMDYIFFKIIVGLKRKACDLGITIIGYCGVMIAGALLGTTTLLSIQFVLIVIFGTASVYLIEKSAKMSMKWEEISEGNIRFWRYKERKLGE